MKVFVRLLGMRYQRLLIAQDVKVPLAASVTLLAALWSGAT